LARNKEMRMTLPPMTFEKKPFRSSVRTVQPDWIDYNGHMNVGYYTLAIDQAMDEVFDALGLGIELAKSRRLGPMAMVTTVHYLDELLEGQSFACDFQMLDSDHKRVHYFVTMHHLDKGTVAATMEGLSTNVDLEARRSADYPDDVRARIAALTEAHAGLARPARAGATIGIRRKG